MATVQGLKELNAKLKAMKDISPKSVVAGGYVLLKHAVINAPFKTGFLKGSGYCEQKDNGAEVGFTANYAEVQEFGSVERHIPAKGYLRRAIDENEQEILDKVAEELAKELGGK